MRRFVLTLFLLFNFLCISSAENVLILNSAFARPGDTITVSTSIRNTERFISFQFDLQLPDHVSFLGYSIQMSERSINHVAIGNMVGSNMLRIFSYSPNNAAFKGNEGIVVSFRLVIGNIRGEFPLTLENGIIGDSLSHNIMTGHENGVLSVFPLGMDESSTRENNPIEKAKIYPNPLIPSSILSLELTAETDLALQILDFAGQEVYANSPVTMKPGFLEYGLLNMLPGYNAAGVYYLRLFSRTQSYTLFTIPFVIK